MSRYVQYQIANMKNQEILLAALAELGWDSGKVEVHDQPVALYGYHGDARAEKAHIVIRRSQTGVGSSNDIGFVREADGTYRPIISEYDQSACRAGYGNKTYKGAATKGLSETLEKAYSRVAGDRAISTILTKTLPRMKAQGLVPRHATAKVTQTGQSRKIVVAY